MNQRFVDTRPPVQATSDNVWRLLMRRNGRWIPVETAPEGNNRDVMEARGVSLSLTTTDAYGLERTNGNYYEWTPFLVFVDGHTYSPS